MKRKAIAENLQRHTGSAVSERDIDVECACAEKAGVSVITPADAAYPRLLKEIHDPPPVLYCKGEFSSLDDRAVAVVGSRKPSVYGIETAERLARELGENGYTTISGLARGIDAAAHTGALSCGARTIAVLGSGLAALYPPENIQLAERIARNGAVISEFPMHAEPLRMHFPMRNRIISGLSRGVVVVEAAEKSGSLITADFALEQGRDVFSVPGRIDSAVSRGTLNLIRNGAKVVVSVADILEEVDEPSLFGAGRMPVSQERSIPEMTQQEQLIFQALDSTPKHIDDLFTTVPGSIAPGTVAASLLRLEAKGLIREVPGKQFVRLFS